MRNFISMSEAAERGSKKKKMVVDFSGADGSKTCFPPSRFSSSRSGMVIEEEGPAARGAAEDTEVERSMREVSTHTKGSRRRVAVRFGRAKRLPLSIS
jgi:hypothetical protein